jgi:omega-6 fatty acid desaturase (delta-12 desaturase)
MRDQARLAEASRVSLVKSFACARLALWDEAETKLVSFREARRRAR